MSDMRAWWDPNGGWTVPDTGQETTYYTRHVLVVDPEKSEHIEAICTELADRGYPMIRADLRDALRSLLAPPKTKPAEPDEHGAKVIDKGVQWVAGCQRRWGGWSWQSEDGTTRHWRDFSDDVEVLP